MASRSMQNVVGNGLVFSTVIYFVYNLPWAISPKCIERSGTTFTSVYLTFAVTFSDVLINICFVVGSENITDATGLFYKSESQEEKKSKRRMR